MGPAQPGEASFYTGKSCRGLQFLERAWNQDWRVSRGIFAPFGVFLLLHLSQKQPRAVGGAGHCLSTAVSLFQQLEE